VGQLRPPELLPLELELTLPLELELLDVEELDPLEVEPLLDDEELLALVVEPLLADVPWLVEDMVELLDAAELVELLVPAEELWELVAPEELAADPLDPLVPPVEPAGALLQAQKPAPRTRARVKRMGSLQIDTPPASSTHVAAASRQLLRRVKKRAGPPLYDRPDRGYSLPRFEPSPEVSYETRNEGLDGGAGRARAGCGLLQFFGYGRRRLQLLELQRRPGLRCR
jgi:hypothetical protein